MSKTQKETMMKQNQLRTMRAEIQFPVYRDSLSSMVGLAGIMYGAEAGTGPGVRADSSGERSAKSSELFPQPLM